MPAAPANRGLNLPIVDGRVAQVSGTASGMEQFLSEPNHATMVARLGGEIVIGTRWCDGARVTVVRGETFRHSSADVTGWRYLYRSPEPKDEGRIIGAINLTVQRCGAKTTAVLSNIVVAEGFRRQGIASRLVEMAIDDYPGLALDSAMSIEGGLLFGYAPPSHTDAPAAAPAARTKRKP